jgi:hypothetical protein
MYTHVSKCKDDKIKKVRKKEREVKNDAKVLILSKWVNYQNAEDLDNFWG